MSVKSDNLGNELRAQCGERLVLHVGAGDALTAEVAAADLLAIAQILRAQPTLRFEQLIDVAGVDYLDFGRSEWQAEKATGSGFSRGVNSAAGHTLRGEQPTQIRMRAKQDAEQIEGLAFKPVGGSPDRSE